MALAGLGSRGKDTYAVTAKLFPEKMKIVAIADIDAAKVAECYQIPQEYCFHSAEELLAQEKLADVMFITTQDRQHVGQPIGFAGWEADREFSAGILPGFPGRKRVLLSCPREKYGFQCPGSVLWFCLSALGAVKIAG